MIPALVVRVFRPLVLAATLAGGARALQSPPLNQPLSRLSGGSVREGQITADGKSVVYAADQDEIGVVELFCVPLAGGPAVRISPPIFSRTGYRWGLTPDTRRAVYVVDTDLYSVPIDRSASPVRLSDQPVQPSGSIAFALSPDGSRVVYLACPQGAYSSLYSAPVDGSAAPILLQPASVVGGVIGDYKVSPDGTTVVFASYHADAQRAPLFAVPIDGGPVVQLSHPAGVEVGYPFEEWHFASGGARVVFQSAEEAAGAPQLYMVPTDGSSAPRRLNGPLVPGGAVLDFEVSADGEHVVYLADQRQNDKQELFSVPADGSAPALVLNAPLASDRDVTRFEIHPGSAFVTYRADQELDNCAELYGVPIDASRAPEKLNPPLAPGGNVEWSAFTPDGRQVLLELFAPGSAPNELWRVALARGLPKTRLAEAPDFQQARIAPDGARLLYVSVGVLYSVAVSGGSPPVVLSDPSPNTFEFSADGTRVVTMLRGDSSGACELFSRLADASQPPVKLNGPLVLGEVVADVASFQTTSDGRWLVYLADGFDGDEEPGVGDELFALRADASAAPVRLFPHPAIPGGRDDVAEYRLDATGERVVFYHIDSESEFYEGSLIAAKLDGGLAPVVLDDFDAIRHFEIAPDGVWVVFSVEADDRSERLLASRTDGAEREVELTGALAGPVRAFAVAPDSRSVVFLARRLAGAAEELQRVAIDGSAAPAVLNSALVAGGNVQAFELDRQAQRVVYRADQERDGVDELWSVPLAGGVPATHLSGPLVAGGDVTGFRLTSDGTRVVYAADAERDGTSEPFVVASSGGPVLRLAPPFVEHGGVRALVVTPDDAGLVYLADAEHVGTSELYAVPLDAGALPRKLSGALVAGGDVQNDFELASDGVRVVFRADALADEVFELFSAKLAGSAPPVRISSAPGPGGDVRSFRIAPDGRTVA